MKLQGYIIIPALIFVIISGCGDSSNSTSNSGSANSSFSTSNSQLTNITFEDRGAVTPVSSSSKLSIRTDLTDYSRTNDGKVVEKWSRQVKDEYFDAVESVVKAYSLFDSPDVSPDKSTATCDGWKGMSIIMEKTESSHTLKIDGIVCGRSQWPEGVRKLVNIQDVVINNNVCISYTPPSSDWCSDGNILPPLVNENGCFDPPRCQKNNSSCPEFPPPDPDWCSDGIIQSQPSDQNGCPGPPICVHKKAEIKS